MQDIRVGRPVGRFGCDVGQADVAARAGVSRSFVSLLERVVYGVRGVIDILAWHAATRSLLVIELNTEIVDVTELVGTMDRKRRLAARVAREHGWDALSVSCWVIVARDKTNQRRIARHRTMLRAAFQPMGVRCGLGYVS